MAFSLTLAESPPPFTDNMAALPPPFTDNMAALPPPFMDNMAALPPAPVQLEATTSADDLCHPPGASRYVNEVLSFPNWTDKTYCHKADMCGKVSVLEKGEVQEIFCLKKKIV